MQKETFMVARIELLLEKYRVKKPEEMTQDELAVYNNQMDAAKASHDADIERIKQEIKDSKDKAYENIKKDDAKKKFIKSAQV